MEPTTSEPLSRVINLLGALVVGAGDDLKHSTEQEAGAGGAFPAALLALDTWPDESIGFLAQILDLSHSGTVRLVAHLRSAGLVERSLGRDARTAAVRLTLKGQEVARAVRDTRYRLLRDRVSGLTEDEQQTLVNLLERLLGSRPLSRTQAQRTCRLCDHTICRGEACPVGSSVHAA